MLIIDSKQALIVKRFQAWGIVLDVRFNSLQEEILYASTQDGAVKGFDLVLGTEIFNLQASN